MCEQGEAEASPVPHVAALSYGARRGGGGGQLEHMRLCVHVCVCVCKELGAHISSPRARSQGRITADASQSRLVVAPMAHLTMTRLKARARTVSARFDTVIGFAVSAARQRRSGVSSGGRCLMFPPRRSQLGGRLWRQRPPTLMRSRRRAA